MAIYIKIEEKTLIVGVVANASVSDDMQVERVVEYVQGFLGEIEGANVGFEVIRSFANFD